MGGRRGGLTLVTVEGAAPVSPGPALFEEMLAGWRRQQQARRLSARAGQPCRYVEVDGANHPFAWHRAELRDLVISWLDDHF